RPPTPPFYNLFCHSYRQHQHPGHHPSSRGDGGNTFLLFIILRHLSLGINSKIFFRKLKSVLFLSYRSKKKYHNMYLHVLPVICDGGFSRCAACGCNALESTQLHHYSPSTYPHW